MAAGVEASRSGSYSRGRPIERPGSFGREALAHGHARDGRGVGAAISERSSFLRPHR
jgi:hypothetical protein